MRKLLLIIIFLISIIDSFGQEKMIVDRPYNGNTVYNGFSEHLDSISELPSVILFNLKGYLDRILGSMSDSVTFSHGQVVDVESYFKTDSATFGYGWVVPKYDLNFILKDKSLGIKKYYLQIRLDKYGQFLSSNWPKEKHADRNKFKNRTDIEKFALKQADLKGFDTTNYEVEFTYNEKSDKLCWIFKFVGLNDKYRKEYNVLEIPWNFIEIIDEYNIMTSTVY